MTDSIQEAAHQGNPFLSERDEMSLAAERAAQTDQSVPDTFEVRDDSFAIAQDTVGRLRGPVLVTAAVVGAVILLAVGVGILTRSGRTEVPS